MEGRDEKGLFAKGNKLSPGRPAGVFHTLSDTRSRFLETLPRSEIIAIAANPARLDEYTAFQSMVLIGLAEALKETPLDKLDPSKERERMYNREIGMPTQPVSGDVLVTDDVEILLRARQRLAKMREQKT